MNSKAEFNRCYIPRLRLEEKEETDKREQEMRAQDRLMEQTLDREQGEWEKRRTDDRDKERRELGRQIGPPNQVYRGAKSRAREQSTSGSAPKKRKKSRKFDLIGEDWGVAAPEEQNTQEHRESAPSTIPVGADHPPPPPPPPPLVGSSDGAGAPIQRMEQDPLEPPDGAGMSMETMEGGVPPSCPPTPLMDQSGKP